MFRRSYLVLLSFCLGLLLFLLIGTGPSALAAPAAQEGTPKLFPPPTNVETGYLEVDAPHRLFYVLCGNPEGRPVMCLHGGPGVGCYPRMTQYFNPEKYRIVLHDQRGAGKSVPHGELSGNTTQNLVADIERLRKHLNLGKVVIFGGSWGSTLALAYAEAHPENVAGLILRGVFLGTEEEIEFHYLGTRFFFPKEHQALLSLLPDPTRGTHPDYIYDLIREGDTEQARRILQALAHFELKFMKLNMPDETVEAFLKGTPPDEEYRTARLDLHYVKNRYFLKEGQLLDGLKNIQGIPAILINGRYDMAAPPRSAYLVHQGLPGSKLVIVEEAGHSESEEGITAALIEATAEFESLPQ